MTDTEVTGPTCGVCGTPLTAEALDPPTFTLERVELEDGTFVVRPVLNKPIRMDPETGAFCWCELK